MALQTVPERPRVGELLQIGLGGAAGLVVGALAGAATFQSAIVALLGGMGGAVCGLIAALKRIEGDQGASPTEGDVGRGAVRSCRMG